VKHGHDEEEAFSVIARRLDAWIGVMQRVGWVHGEAPDKYVRV
jgi:hypothetical protein